MNDLREKSALKLSGQLRSFMLDEFAIEPNVSKVGPAEKFELISQHKTSEIGDISLMLVDHKQFRNMDKPKSLILIDTKNIW